MSRPIDRDALLAFLDRKVEERGRANTSGLVITSVYSGLANRIRSGEFDEEIKAGPWGPVEQGPVEKCRECGLEEWGHSWLDHVK